MKRRRDQLFRPSAPVTGIGPEQLRIERVSKRFETSSGKITALDDVTLTIEAGEFMTILGPSGCGKTTLLRILAGFEEPDAGKISLGKTLLNTLPPHRRDMPMVFQSYALFPHLSVFDNIAYGLRIKKRSDRSIQDTVEMILHLMNLIGLETRFPDQLSGGQQQRVALARCLVMQPRILLFDEPLSNLDAKLRVQMRDEIHSLQRRLGITAIYVTHDQTEAISLSDRIVVMRGGRIEQIGPPAEIYTRPASMWVADFVGKANFIQGVVKSVEGGLEVEAVERTIHISSSDAPVSPGQKVSLMIRPEAVVVEDHPGGGVVKRATYLGPVVEYEVEIEGHVIIAVDSNPRRPRIFSEGDQVSVSFLEDCFHVIPRGGEELL